MAVARRGPGDPVIAYAPERTCLVATRADGPGDRPWPWPDLTPIDLGVLDTPGATHQSRLDRAHAAVLLGADGGVGSVLVRGPTGDGGYYLIARALMPDEACPPFRS